MSNDAYRQDQRRGRREASKRIDALCDEFESRWMKGLRPDIEEFLDFVEDAGDVERAALLRELVLTDLELRRTAGESIGPADYSLRYPDLAPWLKIAGTTDDPSALDLCPLFRAVPKQVLLAQMHLRSFERGQTLLRQGDPADSLMVISEGHVEIHSTGPDGRRLSIDHSVRGDVLGEMALLSRDSRTADAVALDRVEALVLPAERFHELAHRFPELSVELSQLVAQRLGKPDRDALTDKVLDQYRIIRRLGRGGMGIVYQAETLDGKKTPVALKMMSHRLVYDRRARAHFEQEANIIQSLRHPNIIQTFGRFAAFHTYFLVLEFCPGQALDEILAAEGPLSENQARPILGQLAAALSYANHSGILHRDLKPGNVMLITPGRVKLMDFGLAEPVAAAGQEAGRIFGTPRYMAPEQRRGERVDQRADYFAFACLAYELMLGRPLFDGNGVEELLRDFRGWRPPPLNQLRPDVSEEFSAAILPALHPESALRELDLARIAAWHDENPWDSLRGAAPE